MDFSVQFTSKLEIWSDFMLENIVKCPAFYTGLDFLGSKKDIFLFVFDFR